jgi:hypothetical protein
MTSLAHQHGENWGEWSKRVRGEITNALGTRLQAIKPHLTDTQVNMLAHYAAMFDESVFNMADVAGGRWRRARADAEEYALSFFEELASAESGVVEDQRQAIHAATPHYGQF